MKLADILAEMQPGADYLIYTIKGHPDDVMLIGRDAQGDWQRAGRVWAELRPAIVEGLSRAGKALWDADRRAFLTGTVEQLAYAPPPPPPAPPPRPSKSAPQHERNWILWRSYKVDGERYITLAKRHGITGSRVANIVAKCDREAALFLRWPDLVSEERAQRILTALEGIELIFPADDPDYMRMPDGREFYLSGKRKED